MFCVHTPKDRPATPAVTPSVSDAATRRVSWTCRWRTEHAQGRGGTDVRGAGSARPRYRRRRPGRGGQLGGNAAELVRVGHDVDAPCLDPVRLDQADVGQLARV